MKTKYDIVFVVLVYGNTEDIVDFFKSIKNINCKYKVILVNSFYNEVSLRECRNVAKKYDSILLEVENRGYGAGNNRGIEFAMQQYEFEFLIVSNPDIIVKKLYFSDLKKYSRNVLGPKIITSTGKNQNPFYVDRKPFPKAEYFFLKNRIKIGYYSILLINKIKKYLLYFSMYRRHTSISKVYALHGSFIIFSYFALRKIGEVFDENIFLFCEEMVLAEKMKKNGVIPIYTSNIEVHHKEDGSMNFLSGSMYDEEVKSNEYVVKKYFS